MNSNTQATYCLAIIGGLILFVGLGHMRPQQFSRPDWNQFRPDNDNQWNPQNPFLPVQSQQPSDNTITTTVNPPTATTASPGYLNCLQSCPGTPEYNPICGSDGVNYMNNGRLRCAVFCGRSVTAVRQGTCNPL